MLALLNRELGGETVRDILENKNVTSYAHAVNLCEVFYDFGPQSLADNRERAELFLQRLFLTGVTERQDMDAEFWRDIAFLIAERRAQLPRPEKPNEKSRLALGDAFGLALARRLDCEFVTADKTEIEPLQNAGLCRAHFIR